MSDIDIRKLKTHSSEVIRKVKEEGARYIVTYRGRPVAAIVPLDHDQDAVNDQALQPAWEELERLGERISQEWNSPKTGVEILSDICR